MSALQDTDAVKQMAHWALDALRAAEVAIREAALEHIAMEGAIGNGGELYPVGTRQIVDDANGLIGRLQVAAQMLGRLF